MTMKKTIIISAILIFVIQELSAQTDFQFSNYMYNQLAINPAYAGASKDVNIALLGRSQWTGLDNGTQSFGLNAHTIIPSIGGIGITMYRNKIGYELNTAAKLSYAHTFKFKDSLSLSFGLSAGITSRSIELDQLIFASNEPLLQNGSLETKIKPDFGFGARFLWKNLDIQLASAHLSNKLDPYDYNNIPRHFYGIASYNYHLNKKLTITPSVFFKSNGTFSQVDANVQIIYQDRFLGGLGYRIDQAVIATLGIKITDNISFVYSYDFITGPTNVLSPSNHEIVLIGRLNGFYKGIKNNGSKASF